MASMSFGNFNFSEISYRENKNLNIDNIEKFEVDSDFKATIGYKNDYAFIALKCTVGDTKENCPFIINIQLESYFEVEYDEDDKEDIEEVKNLLSVNAIAILYPYVRSLVSDLTSKANGFETYIMPIANISQYMKDNDKINIINIE